MRTNRPAKNIMTDAQLSVFCSQLTLVIGSGISPYEGMMVMAETGDETEKALFLKIAEDIDETGSLAEALKRNQFPHYMVEMIRLGEEAGETDRVLEELAFYYERESTIRESIRSGLTYPAIMAIMMLAVIAILLIKVMPIFSQVFHQMGTEMSGISKGLLSVGQFLGTYGMIPLGLIICLILAVYILIRIRKGMAWLSGLGRKFTFIREVHEMKSRAAIASGIATALKSGLVPERALEISAELVEDPKIREKIEDAKKKVEEGEQMAKALRETGLFGGMYAKLMVMGEKTGDLDQVMSKVAKMSAEEVDDTINRRLALVEPALVITMSVVVGIILLSVMLPLLGILSGI